jgi:hypothetical protein
MPTYAALLEELHGRNQKNTLPHTRIERLNDYHIGIFYYSTLILLFDDQGNVTIDAKGHRNRTIKQRMSYYLPGAWVIIQQRNVWHLYDYATKEKKPYVDGMTLYKEVKR